MNLVEKVLALAAENGYKAFRVEDHDTFGYIITPDDNVMSVCRGTWGGVTFTLNYIPSKEHGQGCSCKDEDIYRVPSLEELKDLELAGINFAKRLNAKPFNNSDQWYKQNYWQQKGMLKEVST